MAYAQNPQHPIKSQGDQFISEQVEVLAFEKEDAATIQTAVNDYLITLREAAEHLVVVRSVEFQLEKIKKDGDEVNTLVTIHYRLVGTTDLPYLP